MGRKFIETENLLTFSMMIMEITKLPHKILTKSMTMKFLIIDFGKRSILTIR